MYLITGLCLWYSNWNIVSNIAVCYLPYTWSNYWTFFLGWTLRIEYPWLHCIMAKRLVIPYGDETCHSLITIERSDVAINNTYVSQTISDLHINPSFLSFFEIFFRSWGNAARLFFSLSDVIFATLVKFGRIPHQSCVFAKAFYIWYLC